jgi:gluconate 2-dehydrogenase gamma chain
MKTPADGTRRKFLFRSASGLGAAWMISNWPAILAAQQHAHTAATATTPPHLEFFSPTQAAEVEAMAAQIIPADETPGAREAHVVYFIDRALVTFDHEQQVAYAQGLVELRGKVAAMFTGSASFAALSSERQIQLLTAIEKTDFFERVRVHTIMGFLSDPSYGGNFDQIGWKLIGMENAAVHTRPFGYYDAEDAKEKSGEK